MTDSLRPTRVPGFNLAALDPRVDAVVTGVCIDSRCVQPGDLYVAVAGEHVHGADFASAAVARGAAAVVTDHLAAQRLADLGVPVLAVDDPRAEMGQIAAAVYGHPASQLEMFGVTGTNGKTSTVFLLEAALSATGRCVATIGTIGFRVAGRGIAMRRGTVTTPDAPELQGMLAAMAERGVDSVAMEVSSHALALHRVAGITFDVAGFTMFGQDHLDFHHDLESYFEAKALLFDAAVAKTSVVNADDATGMGLVERIRASGGRVATTGVDSPADYRVESWTAVDGSARVRATTPQGPLDYEISMLGEFNIRNSLTALAMVGEAGLDVGAAAAGLASAQVPGRMQRVTLGAGKPHVVVDFAHTPQAVEAALNALPRPGRHIAVLGAGGDRDPHKREPMGAAAARASDVVIVTDDNPRTEDPDAIRTAVLRGARAAASPNTQVIDGGDRAEAIAYALDLADEGDWVAILGKGHETGQIVGDVARPFDDVEQVLAWAGR